MPIDLDTSFNSPGVYGVMGVPSQTNKPPARSSAATWTDTAGNFWLFGGHRDKVLLKDLWRYTPATKEWTWISGDKFQQTLYFVPIHGQSLSYGGQGYPSISLDGIANAYKFGGGVRPSQSAIGDIAYQSLAPLAEDAEEPETPASGHANAFLQSLVSDGSVEDISLLISCTGSGGLSIAEFQKGTLIYKRLIYELVFAKQRATELGKAFNMPYFVWIQGDKDINVNTTKAAYKSALVNLYNDLNTDVKGITGQTNDLKCITYQPETQSKPVLAANDPAVSLALYELCTQDDRFALATPMYNKEFKTFPHVYNVGYRQLGYETGFVAKKVIVDQQRWLPIFPISDSIQNTTVDVTFNVPAPPLVLDTNWVSNPGSYGFRVFNSGGQQVDIDSISLIRPNALRISTHSNITGGELWYGIIEGAIFNSGVPVSRGCLRDSQGDKVKFNGYAFHNACPVFKYKL